MGKSARPRTVSAPCPDRWARQRLTDDVEFIGTFNSGCESIPMFYILVSTSRGSVTLSIQLAFAILRQGWRHLA